MKKPGYKEAIRWIAENDDTEWLFESVPEDWMSVSAIMVRDLFDVTDEKIIADLKKALEP